MPRDILEDVAEVQEKVFVIDFPDLHEAQQVVKDSPARWKILCAGRRFGKSRLGVQLCIEKALDGGRVWWVAPTFSIARVGWRDVVAAASVFPKESGVDAYPTHDLSNYEQFIATINYSNPGTYTQESYNRNKHVRHIEPSCTDISYQVYIDVKFYNTDSKKDYPVKVQLIGKDFIGPVEETLNTFDFANVQIAYYIKDGQLFRCQRKDSVPSTRKNKLDVVNSHSPLLMHRIYKYMTHRGYEGVTESSKQHIVDWLIRARSGEFKNPVLGITLWEDALNNRVIKRAIYDRTIPDDALPLIIGKVITEKRVYRGYRRYDYVQIDEAMAAIKERKTSSSS